jgi:hypothetical protein
MISKGERGRRRGKGSFSRYWERKSCGAENLRRADGLAPD